MGNVFWWNVWVIVSAVIVVALIVGAVVMIKRTARRAAEIEAHPRD